jgi:hypothetical protein
MRICLNDGYFIIRRQGFYITHMAVRVRYMKHRVNTPDVMLTMHYYESFPGETRAFVCRLTSR